MYINNQTITALANIITGDGAESSYRSGPKLVDFFNDLGSNEIYGQGFPSRWYYTEEKIREVNGSELIEKILIKAVDPRDFIEFPNKENNAVTKLNNYLEYDGYRLTKTGMYYLVESLETSQTQKSKNIQNIIFASTGPKPEIILTDAIHNEIKIVKNKQFCLLYDKPVSPIHGLTLKQLQDWYYSKSPQPNLSDRLKQSLGSKAEEAIFNIYYTLISEYGDNLPALIPQVYLHYDPKTIRELHGMKRLERQRMDFLLLLPNNIRIVIEIDGKQHYSDEENRASPQKYAQMMEEDRKLQLNGYKIFRFGGYELNQPNTRDTIQEFFVKLLEIYRVFPKRE